jgi:ferredoxin
MLSATINHNPIQVAEGATILDAARQAKIHIPTLCHVEGREALGACRVCIVEVKGARTLMPACATPVTPGMEIFTNTARVRHARRQVLELLLSEHDGNCQVCGRNQDCELQEMANELGIQRLRYEGEKTAAHIDDTTPALIRDNAKCIKCRRCVTVCGQVQGIGALFPQGRGFQTVIGPAFTKDLSDVACVQCGQCAAICPVGAISRKRATWTTSGPRWRIRRSTSSSRPPRPSAPRWARSSATTRHPHAQPVHLQVAAADVRRRGQDLLRPRRRARSPRTCGRLGHALHGQEVRGPAARDERQRRAGRGLRADHPGAGRMIRRRASTSPGCRTTEMDPLMGFSSGAADIFANTGGVMEAALRTAWEIVTGRELPFENLHVTPVAGLEGIKEAAITITGTVPEWSFLEGVTLKVAVSSRPGQRPQDCWSGSRKGERVYHFVEVMTCPGGCIGGGGQPRFTDDAVRQKRIAAIYAEDEGKKLRKSHENPNDRSRSTRSSSASRWARMSHQASAHASREKGFWMKKTPSSSTPWGAMTSSV